MQDALDELGIFLLARAHDEVETFLDEINRAVSKMNIEADLRVLGNKCRQFGHEGHAPANAG